MQNLIRVSALHLAEVARGLRTVTLWGTAIICFWSAQTLAQTTSTQCGASQTDINDDNASFSIEFSPTTGAACGSLAAGTTDVLNGIIIRVNHIAGENFADVQISASLNRGGSAIFGGQSSPFDGNTLGNNVSSLRTLRVLASRSDPAEDIGIETITYTSLSGDKWTVRFSQISSAGFYQKINPDPQKVDFGGYTVEFTPGNNDPTASAGPDQSVNSNQNVTLNGSSSSDPDNDSLNYSWSQSSGTSVSLSNASGAQSTFSAPNLAINAADTTLVFELTVSDGNGGSDTDGVRITVVSDKAPAETTSAFTSTGPYKAGDTIDYKMTLTEDVTVDTSGGSPSLDLVVGSNTQSMPMSSANGDEITFTYTVADGDTDADGVAVVQDSLSLNGSTITGDTTTQTVVLENVATNGSAPAQTVDTTAPVVTDSAISISGATGTGGVFKVGDTITASWDTSGSDGDTNISASLGDVTVDFSEFAGGATVSAALSGTTWTASYTIAANSSTSGSNLNVAVTATDEAGNSTTTADTTDASADATPPIVASTHISLNGATGTSGAFKIGDTVTASWDNSASGGNNSDISSVTLDFSQFGGGAAVAATGASGVWTASFQITAGSIDATNRNVSVSATDAVGNTTTTADATNATVDSITPSVSAANISVSGATGNPTNSVFKIGDTVTVTWDNTAGGENNGDIISRVTVDFTDFGGGAAVDATNSGNTWTATYLYTAGNVAGNSYSVAVTATDNAGNAATTSDDASLSLDNVETDAPNGILLDVSTNTGLITDTVTSVAKPKLIGNSEANAAVTLYVDTVSLTAVSADGSGDWAYTFTSDLADGTYEITTTATDAVGNVSTISAALSLIIDTIAPTQPSAPVLDASSNTGSTSDLLTADTTPEFSGTAEANSTVEIFVGGVSVGTAVADGTGAWSFTVPDGSLSEGANVIWVTNTDLAGNTSAVSSSLSITLDTSAPTITITDPLMGDNLFSASETASVVLSGTTTDAPDNKSVALGVSDGTSTLNFTTTVARNTWSISVDLGSLADGSLQITADVTNDAGTSAPQARHTIVKDTSSPTVTITGPTAIVTSAFDVSIVFSENVSGLTLSEVDVTNGTATELIGSGSAYTVTIIPVMGQTITVSIAAGVALDSAGNSSSRSNVFEVESGSPGSEFEKHKSEILKVLVEDASRHLRSNIASNRSTIRFARDRFIEFRQTQEREAEVTRALIPFDVDGNFTLSESGLNTAGNFFQQVGNEEGTYRRLFFGDFDVQHDNDTDSTTATLTGRVALEQMAGDATMLGYFIGAELATSTIDDSFEGDQNRLGATAGGYVVHELDAQVYFAGFATLGAGQNDLDMTNGTLALTSNYETKSATFGGALTGVFSRKGFDFIPELAFTYGKTWLDDVGFTGRAYGLVDDTLSLDAGTVSLANLTLRPELVFPIGTDFVADSNTQFAFAPRLICERVKTTVDTSDCGAGGEFGLNSQSDDGLSSANMRIQMDRINGGTRSSVALSLEHRF